MVATRRVLTATILALAAFGLLLAGTGAANAQDQAGGLDGSFGVAPSKPGDRMVYALHMIRIEDGEKGGWAYDAGARLEVERMGDRVIPVDGTPQVASSFASTWTTRDINWVAWLNDWDVEEFEEEMEEFEEEMEAWEDEMEDADWDDASGWDGYGAAMSDWGTAFAGLFDGLFGGLDRIKGEPWHVAHIDPAHRVVATTRAGSDPDLPGGQLARDLGIDPSTTVVTTFGPSSAPCGFSSDLQGAIVPLDDAVRVSGDCPPAGGHFGTAPDNLTSDRFVAVGYDVVQGQPAVVFAHEGGADNLRLWFTEQVPYPVRMVVPVLVTDGYYVHLLYEMSDFRPGTLQAAQAPAAVDLLPRLTWGPDAAGVETPFSLEQAVQAARIDLRDGDTRDWMAAHPDAAVDEAHFLRITDAGVQRDQWRFTMVSGGDALFVTATKGPPEPPVQPEGVPALPTVPPGTLPPEVEDNVAIDGQPGSSAGRISLTQLPATLPHVGGVLALWQADGQGGGVPAWAFRLRPDGSTWMAVGSAEAAITRDGTGDEVDTRLEYSYYGVGPDGSFLFVEESPARYEVPAAEDPDAMPNADPRADEDWSDPDGFLLASVGYWEFPEARTTATVGAAAGLVGLVAYALLPAKYGAMGLFSRIGNDQVLEHPLRQQITDLVAAEPGIHFQELVRRLDAGRGTMEHHLRKLVAANVLTMQVSQGFTCFFPKGKVDRHLMAAAPVLKSEGARQVLQAIQEQPGRAALDVAAAVGLTPSTVNYHLKRLVASGLVSHERRGRFILLTPTPLGTQALGAWGRP